jgi:hypothetical protein
VAAPFAYGSGEVPALARELAVVEAPATAAVLDHDHDQHDHDHEGEESEAERGPKYLPTADAVCGPGGSGMSANKTSWKGTRAYDLAGYHIGVRYNSEATAEVLDRLFAASAVDDPAVPDNYSVALYPPGAGRSRDLNLLVRLGQQLVRSRSAERVLRAMLAHMSVDLQPPREDLLYLDATPAVQDGRGLLLPPAMVAWIKQLQPRLARLRIQLVDNPFATVDARTGELVVAEPTIEHDPAVLDAVDQGVRLGSELPMVRPGRYPLSRWYFVVEEGQDGSLPRARAVAAGIGLILGRPDVRGAVDELMDVVSVVDGRGIVFDGPEELADRLAETA